MSGKKSNPDQTALPFVGDLLLYQTEDGQTRIEVRLQDESVWMTQAMMAELFQTTTQNITLHIKAIYRDGELQVAATCKEYLHVQTEGKRNISRARKFYNLPVIFAISGKTAAELIADRADASQPNMGLTAWKGAKVRKGDVAKLSGEKTMNLTTQDQYVLIFQTLCRQ
ncbi:RhuM family protein [Methylotuvimicrobium buryatense]|uniref:Uncharacterized protein n=1 Tax=Methylotuvimicrobium buryatense TaxID=95641 RepID=A0A4P9UQC6_METBY|nr:RhuM family protein [Methylotuvimicrobium buryatense]QCW83634.1 hypothetical protein EQU24_16345 [Methylotuvimicrobium buryatense]